MVHIVNDLKSSWISKDLLISGGIRLLWLISFRMGSLTDNGMTGLLYFLVWISLTVASNYYLDD